MKLITNIKAFTFIEVIMTIVVVGIIVGVSVNSMFSGMDAYNFIVNRKEATQYARAGMERMVSELILVTPADLTWMGSEHIGFVDRDRNATSFKKNIKGDIPTLYRGNDFLAGQLGFVDFDYLKADGTSTLISSQVKKINIELSIISQGGYGDIGLRTEVFPRNMMYKDFRRYP